MELKRAVLTAQKAGKSILEIYSKKYKVYTKEDKSPVTEADFLSQEIIFEELKEFGYDFLSEEKIPSSFSHKKRWIIDPLDGTEDFLTKTDEFSIMIGLVENNEPVLAVVYLPVSDKLYWAEKGKGSFLGEKRLEVSKVSELKDSRFVVSRFHLDEKTKSFLKNVKDMVQVGSVGIKVGLIAEGKAEGYLTFSGKTSKWDTCAPELILKEAGGKVSDLKGDNLDYSSKETRNSGGVVFSNEKIYSELIKELDRFSPDKKSAL